MRPFRFGLVCTRPQSGPAALARSAQAAGYATLLFPDHLGMLAPFPAMMAAAAAADLRVGTQVINIAFRPLGLLAQEAATVDVLSGGRLELGLGAGYAEGELRSIGLPFPTARQRIEAVATTIRALRRLFAGETVTDSGLSQCSLEPLPPQGARVPVMVGGNGDAMLRVAAQLADIVQFTGFTAPPGRSFAGFTTEGLVDRVEYVRQQAGVRFADLELSILVQWAMVTDSPDGVAAELSGRTGGALTAAALRSSPFALLGNVDEICGRLLEIRERTGVSYVSVFDGRSAGFDAVVGRLAGR
jgi:probable F420-dependent oxidoreductase